MKTLGKDYTGLFIVHLKAHIILFIVSSLNFILITIFYPSAISYDSKSKLTKSNMINFPAPINVKATGRFKSFTFLEFTFITEAGQKINYSAI